MYFEFLFKKGALEKSWDLILYEYNLLGNRKTVKVRPHYLYNKKNDRYSVT